MKVTLINAPSMGAVEVCEEAAVMSTQSGKPMQALRAVIRSGHDSVLEHASFTFKIEGVSRVLLAQLTRHRIASFTVLSQRYVNQEDQSCIVPATIRNNAEVYAVYEALIQRIGRFYHAMIESGIPKEDARYILPEGTTTDLIMSMNARELGHFFRLRCCNRAQQEIRDLADAMLRILRRQYPELFGQAGPACLRGECHEAKPCGHPRKQEERNAKDDE